MRFVYMIIPSDMMNVIDNTCVTTQINISERISIVRIDIDSDYFSRNVRTFSWYDTTKIILDVTSVGEGDALLMDIYAERLAKKTYELLTR